MTKKTALVILFFSFLMIGSLSAQNLAPFRSLKVIRTGKFDIIFPEESRQGAESLSRMADEAYERVSSLLGISVPSRIPVLISPDTDEFNGYLNPLPYPHIVLYDAPLDPEWTTFSDNLYGIFIHELTHAVSLSSRKPVESFLSSIIGTWVLPSYLNAPPYMVEGVTVSFESLDGYGRAHDPLVLQRLRQARFEGRFLSPFQAAGAWDNPSYWNVDYEYGGLFSAYIQDRWGMEVYASLWHEMGGLTPLSFSYYRAGFAGVFRRITGVELKDAWTDFEASFSVDGMQAPGQLFISHRPKDAGDRGDPGEEGLKLSGSVPATPTGGRELIGAMDSDGSQMVWFDKMEHSIYASDAEGGHAEPILRGMGGVTSLDLSEDGSRLLVGSLSYQRGRAVSTAVEYTFDRRDGAYRLVASGRRWTGLFSPHYFRDGLVAIEAETRIQRLVTVDASGSRKTIAIGSDRVAFAEPAVLDDDRIAYLAAVDGKRRLRLYDARSATTYDVIPTSGNDEPWRYARSLKAVGGVLFFSYAAAQGTYRLGTVVGEEATFSGLNLSGGVFSPLPLGDRLIYRAEFATRDSLRLYPKDREDSTAHTERLSLRALDPPPLVAEAPSINPASFDEKPYSPLPYLNPALSWLPYPLIRTSSTDFSFDGLGVISYLADPTDMNIFYLSGGWDSRYRAVFADLLWSGYTFGFPASLELSDSVSQTSSGVPYRSLRAVGSLTWSNPINFHRSTILALGGGTTYVSLSPGLGWVAYASGAGDEAYGWDFSTSIAWGRLSFGLSNRGKRSWDLFGRGTSLNATGYWIPQTSALRGDLVGVLASEPGRIRLVCYGATDGQGMTPSGYSTSFGTSSWVESAEPFADEGQEVSWVAGVEGEFKLFSLEIQGNVSHLYFNRLFGTLAYRGACFDDGALEWTDSITARVGSVITLAPVAASPLSFAPHLWAALSLPALWDGRIEPLLGLSLSMSR